MYILPDDGSEEDQVIDGDAKEPFRKYTGVQAPPQTTWPIIVSKQDFTVFIATNMPYISSEFLIDKHCKYDDGSMYLKWGCGLNRAQAVKLLLEQDKGLEFPFIHSLKAKAFVLDPGTASSCLGACIPNEKIMNVSGNALLN